MVSGTAIQQSPAAVQRKSKSHSGGPAGRWLRCTVGHCGGRPPTDRRYGPGRRAAWSRWRHPTAVVYCRGWRIVHRRHPHREDAPGVAAMQFQKGLEFLSTPRRAQITPRQDRHQQLRGRQLCTDGGADLAVAAQLLVVQPHSVALHLAPELAAQVFAQAVDEAADPVGLTRREGLVVDPGVADEGVVSCCRYGFRFGSPPEILYLI